MRFKNIRELKLNTNMLFEETAKYGPTVITRNGKPIALIRSITEDDFEIKYKSLWKSIKKAAEKSGYNSKNIKSLIMEVRKKNK